jgi:hypothetical protein
MVKKPLGDSEGRSCERPAASSYCNGNISRYLAVFLCPKFAFSSRYTILNDSANYLMLLFCKRINTVQKSCYAARRGIGHLPYKLLSHRSVKRTPAAYDNESEENRRARRIP